MWSRIFLSNLFAFFILAVAAGSLFVLYSVGRPREALAGAGLLILSSLLILWGGRRKKPARKNRDKKHQNDSPADPY